MGENTRIPRWFAVSVYAAMAGTVSVLVALIVWTLGGCSA